MPASSRQFDLGTQTALVFSKLERQTCCIASVYSRLRTFFAVSYFIVPRARESAIYNALERIVIHAGASRVTQRYAFTNL
jgi:hypothetical protein